MGEREMLVLSRFPGERIYINYGTEDEICISLLRVLGDKVSVGILAPKDMNIIREELLTHKRSNDYQSQSEHKLADPDYPVQDCQE